jgi:transglutaminase-like putative cysteine protease
MLIHIGYELLFDVPSPAPTLLKLYLHPSEIPVVRKAERLQVEPHTPVEEFIDSFGNHVGRLILPAGRVRLWNEAIVEDSGQPDVINHSAQRHEVQDLPLEVLPYLLSSRYCEVDLLSETAWKLFGKISPGWVHTHIQFGYAYARPTKTAYEVYMERTGVCRDFAHLAITLCRSLNIPARCVAGYLGDIGVPEQPFPMDFSAWFEVYLNDQWYTFDARHNTPRIGRIVMARGRDAVDTAFTTSFGQVNLEKFTVWTHEVAAVHSVSA